MYSSQRSSFLGFPLLEGVLSTGMNDLVVETPRASGAEPRGKAVI